MGLSCAVIPREKNRLRRSDVFLLENVTYELPIYSKNIDLELVTKTIQFLQFSGEI